MWAKVLIALGGTVGVLVVAAAVWLFSLVVQTGVDLSIKSNLVAFWIINAVIAAGALLAIARVWASVFGA